MNDQQSPTEKITCPKCGAVQPNIYRACWLCGSSFGFDEFKKPLTSFWDKPIVIAVMLGVILLVGLAAIITFLQVCGLAITSR